MTLGGESYNVVYVSAAGAGSRSGDDAANAVKGWQAAYAKLSKTGGTYEDDWNHNILVVVGEMDLKIAETETNGGVPATITGLWPWTKDRYSDSEVGSGGKLKVGNTNTSGAGWRIGSDTRFKNVVFLGASGVQGRLSLMAHNTLFDEGLLMTGWSDLTTEMGATAGRKAPDLHIIIMEDMRATDVNPYRLEQPVNVTIKSGRFGRVLSVRTTGTDNANVLRKYRIGSPNYPLLAKVTVDVSPGNFNAPTPYADDIAYLCAGSTQGAVYGDIEYDIVRGSIATFVAGTQGNAIKVATETSKIPASMFAGRVTVNIEPNDDNDVVIQRYYGANQGRVTSNVTKCEASAYFYGKSVLNMRGGTIENGIYVSSAGVSGLQSEDGLHHTWDPLVPYVNAQNEPTYGPYDAGKTIATVKSRLKGAVEDISLAETQAVINISGGIVRNGVYGGSYGYSEEFAVETKYQFMPRSAGAFFGNTSVNISGGNISGGVYGGGKGSSAFYESWNTSCAHTTRDNFLNVATIYGNTNVTITGSPVISGGIYGAGAGVETAAGSPEEALYVNIARVYGNSYVTIDADEDWVYHGDVYGGGAHGMVDGNTQVVIRKGTVVGSVFGGGHLAPVEGDTKVSIEGSTAIDGNVYGGGNHADVSGCTKVVIGEPCD